MQHSFRCKDEVDINNLMSISPYLLEIFASFTLWSHQRGLPVVVTSIIDDSVKRVSSTHKTGRAIDISARGWDKVSIKEAVEHFNFIYKRYGAVSYSDGQARAIVFHNSGYGDHFHLQVRPNIVNN